MAAAPSTDWIASRRCDRQAQPVRRAASALDHPHLTRHVL
jgi:hypothetical protein